MINLVEFFASRKSSKGFLDAQQVADVGAQYRSVIFYHNNEQRAVAEQVIKKITAAGIWDAPIVTQVEPLKAFCKAEDYHQKYFENNPRQSYCQIVIVPKVRKFREHYRDRLKAGT